MPDDRPVILIVDDEPLTLTRLAEVLDADYQLKAATNGPDALALARQPPLPEVILLDVQMPGMDGYAVCAHLKQGATTAAIPVIFITAQTDADSETAALAGGAVDFIHKAINPAVVRARVRLHLELERRAATLRRVNEQLAQHQEHLEDLVQARTLELAQARDAAQSANRAKSAFLNNVSHEMRTPLNHITGMAYLLQREVAAGQVRERLATIEQSGRHLTDLIRSVLDLSRLEAQELTLETQAFDLGELLAGVVQDQQEAVTAKGLTLVPMPDAALPARLTGDPGRLRQMLGQLLGNAVKFSEQGRISLRVQALEARGTRQLVQFEIADQGIGISPEVVAGLFQRFHQGDDSLTRSYGGLGLGLVLCQRLAHLMGGKIALDSTPGQGTRVRVTVPLGVEGAPVARAGSDSA